MAYGLSKGSLKTNNRYSETTGQAIAAKFFIAQPTNCSDQKSELWEDQNRLICDENF
ncbi:hypothetical protein [[Limnothrix rosea] IAM M-220]|uniref:hypothetical protein n=1 Tax=[Limnothrix rosea] IAM M-220 TaxID=454133 RepID=UPI0015C56F48|nr:hypothetical protein [[Limnothrix rosea] IAM M-220]